MNRLYCVLLMTLIFSQSMAQSYLKLEEEMQGSWTLDSNGDITFSRVVEDIGLNKDDIFNNILSYFTMSYNSGESVTQIKDKEAGLIVGKGFYDYSKGLDLVNKTAHIIRVDIKDNRVRIIITLKETIVVANGFRMNYRLSDRYPINRDNSPKGNGVKVLYARYKSAIASLNSIEKSLKEQGSGAGVGGEW